MKDQIPSSRRIAVIVVAALTAVAMAGCGRGVPPASDIRTLSVSLEAAGFDVQPPAATGPVDAKLFEATSALIVASKEKLLAYEFADQAAAEAAALKVSPDGSGIGAKYVNWSSTPNYYRSGRLIVIYDGRQGPVLTVLEAAMGPVFAGSEPGKAGVVGAGVAAGR